MWKSNSEFDERAAGTNLISTQGAARPAQLVRDAVDVRVH